jgi:hypothetical protein
MLGRQKWAEKIEKVFLVIYGGFKNMEILGPIILFCLNVLLFFIGIMIIRWFFKIDKIVDDLDQINRTSADNHALLLLIEKKIGKETNGKPKGQESEE